MLGISGWVFFIACLAWALWPRYCDEQIGHLPTRKLAPGLEGLISALSEAAWAYRRAADRRRLTR